MLRIKKLFRSILSIRRHYIMKLLLSNKTDELYNNYNLQLVTNQCDLIDGTYTVPMQKKLINKNLNYCETYICKNKSTDSTVGIVSVMYKGGNELEYRIRNIDAFIYNLMVLPSQRGNGIAGCMLLLLEEIFKMKRISSVCLAVSIDNHSAIKAYKKVGCEIIANKSFVRFMRINIPYYCL